MNEFYDYISCYGHYKSCNVICVCISFLSTQSRWPELSLKSTRSLFIKEVQFIYVFPFYSWMIFWISVQTHLVIPSRFHFTVFSPSSWTTGGILESPFSHLLQCLSFLILCHSDIWHYAFYIFQFKWNQSLVTEKVMPNQYYLKTIQPRNRSSQMTFYLHLKPDQYSEDMTLWLTFLLMLSCWP